VPDDRAMADRYFIVLKYDGKVPAMAGCGKCNRKFFVPKNTYSRDPLGATEYLLRKFDQHSCDDPSPMRLQVSEDL